MITLIDYKAGNLTSVRHAFDHLGVPCQISADPDVVRRAERIVIPGVGAAGTAMSILRERGLDTAVREAFQSGTPILGICIGCQIILSHSEEDDTVCLNLLQGHAVRFRLMDPMLKIPHMGWNEVTVVRQHPFLDHFRTGDELYFIHSYYPKPVDDSHVYAVSDYGGKFPAAIGRDNLLAVQFHAEKSGKTGLQLLHNFSIWQ